MLRGAQVPGHLLQITFQAASVRLDCRHNSLNFSGIEVGHADGAVASIDIGDFTGDPTG